MRVGLRNAVSLGECERGESFPHARERAPEWGEGGARAQSRPGPERGSPRQGEAQPAQAQGESSFASELVPGSAEQAGGWGLPQVDKRVQDEIERRRQQEAEAARSAAEPSASAVQPSAPPPTTIKKRSPAALPVSLTIGGIGVVGLGLGTGFLIDGLAKHEDAKDLRSDLQSDDVNCTTEGDSRCGELEKLTKKKDQSTNIATVSFIAGGALVVGAAVTYLVWPKTREVSVGELRLHELVPTLNYERSSGTWQAAIAGKF